MPKDWTCPCGQTEVRFPGNNKIEIKGGYLYGNTKSHYVCRNNKCKAVKRIGYDIVFLDEGGKAYAESADKPGSISKPKARKKPKAKKRESFEWSFD